jgi:DegV family protein with EDD domain
MDSVRVVTDSSTCLPDQVIRDLGIRVVPVTVQLPEAERHEDGSHLSGRISEAIERDQLVRSSHPFITDYLAAIEESGSDDVVVVTPAMEFAGMYRNACLACELAAGVAITIDSRTAAAGQALVVLAGAEAAAAGASMEAVVRAIEDASRRVDLVASLETLAPIRRSHRVPEGALRSTELVEMRSVFRMRSGVVEPLASATTTELALETIHKEWSAATAHEPERSTVFHADCPELAERLRKMLGDVDFVSGFSVAMQVHTGRGVVGAAWIPRA